MALGKPVISTDTIGGSKEIIIDGETGYCTQRNSEQIVVYLNSILNNEDLRLSMGNKGKERIYSHFSIERMGEEFQDIYKKILTRYL
jgi:glycosyltransferase involved in cell wall biosynthesis